MIKELNKWLDKGDGGEWFEPIVTNRDIVFMSVITITISGIIIFGCYLTNL